MPSKRERPGKHRVICLAGKIAKGVLQPDLKQTTPIIEKQAHLKA